MESYLNEFLLKVSLLPSPQLLILLFQGVIRSSIFILFLAHVCQVNFVAIGLRIYKAWIATVIIL